MKDYSFYARLCETQKCIWCKHSFDNGIIRKTPNKEKKNVYDLFTTEFLIHSMTTHGFTPEIITIMFQGKV